MTDEIDKVRENRLRRTAERQLMRLSKTRRRDPRAWDYGLYWLLDARTRGNVTVGGGPSTLDEIEAQLMARERVSRKPSAR